MNIPSKEELVNMYYVQNMTLLEIGKKCGVCLETARKWIKKNGIASKKMASYSPYFYDGVKKECSKCHRILDVCNFNNRKNGLGGKREYCNECRNIKWIKYRIKHPEKTKIYNQRAKNKIKEKYFYDGVNKECRKCREIRPVKDFRRARLGLFHTCRICSGEYEKEKKKEEKRRIKQEQIKFNKENKKERVKKFSRERRKRNQDILNLIKITNKCYICGEDKLPCLDFHHIIPLNRNRKSKKESVINYRSSKKRMFKEIAKCCVLCSNCHRLVHSGDITQTLAPIDITPYLPTT